MKRHMLQNQDKRWSIRMRILISLLCIGLVHCMLPADTEADDAFEDVVEAVNNSPVVQAEVTRVRKSVNAKKSVKENINVLSLGGGCGVAGCDTRYLAVITVHRGGVNPQTGSVLATVERHTPGKLGKVRIVELKTKEAVETKLEIQRRYFSHSPILNNTKDALEVQPGQYTRSRTTRAGVTARPVVPIAESISMILYKA